VRLQQGPKVAEEKLSMVQAREKGIAARIALQTPFHNQTLSEKIGQHLTAWHHCFRSVEVKEWQATYAKNQAMA
jgi:hypothetical protein